MCSETVLRSLQKSTCEKILFEENSLCCYDRSLAVNKKNHEYLILWHYVKKYVNIHMVHYPPHIKISTASVQNALFWKITITQKQDEGSPLNLSSKFWRKPRHAYPDLSLNFWIKPRHAYPDFSLKFWIKPQHAYPDLSLKFQLKPRHVYPEHCEGNA